MKFDSKICAITASVIAFIFWILIDNTYDNGDSITHYAISRYSWQHGYLLFDNWGKPVFTILSSPFSQFGWKGMTFFNCLAGVITCCLMAQIIDTLKWNISPYCALLLFFIPNFPLALNSGLTEPLYALVLIATIYLIIIDRYGWAAIVISFLPFVRSEGFISIVVIAIFFIANNRWKEILLLFTGLVCMSLIGFVFQYESIFWIFTTNPYTANPGLDNYGSGNWDDFFVKFYYMTGIPFTILFWISTLLLIKIVATRLIRNFKKGFEGIEFLLFGLFFSFFLAHVVFWKFGLYHSFGMSRVLISILPVGLLMILYLLNLLNQHSYINKIAFVICVACIIIFPFTNNKSAWNYSKDFAEDPETLAIKSISKDVMIDTIQTDRIYYTSTPFMILLGCDIYDIDKFKPIDSLKNDIKPDCNYIVVKDEWFMKIESNVVDSDRIFSNLKKIYYKKISNTNSIEIYSNDLYVHSDNSPE